MIAVSTCKEKGLVLSVFTRIEHVVTKGKWFYHSGQKRTVEEDIMKAPWSACLDAPHPLRKAFAQGFAWMSLPIQRFEESLVEAVRENQVLILLGETGSGKTTQLPQFLYRHGFSNGGKLIGCTQPRRVAATSVARRVASEMGDRIGGLVGYSIRFEDKTSSKTRLKYMTDGTLLREFMQDSMLEKYSVIMVDEAHERSVNTDILLGLLKRIIKSRSDLRIIVSSATLDAEHFSDYFNGAPVFRIPGRRFPVEVFYTKEPESDYLVAAVKTVTQIHEQEGPGDILVFLTGQEEIESAVELLHFYIQKAGTKIRELIVCPIYSALPSEQQAKIFLPTPKNARKVVVATNIAETSITIDGIVYVVDCGFSKQKAYNPRTGMDALVVVPISKSSANQRAGRAGRVSPGKCYRLYTSWAYQNELDDASIPEIERSNLSSVVLLLKTLKIDNVLHFDYLVAPPIETLQKSLEELREVGALNDLQRMTPLGAQMAELPLDPGYSRALLAGFENGCADEMLCVVSVLSVQGSLFQRPSGKIKQAEASHKSFAIEESDHLTILNIFQKWLESHRSDSWCRHRFIDSRVLRQAYDVKEQLSGITKRLNVSENQKTESLNTPIFKSMIAGFRKNIAILSSDGDGYELSLRTKEKVYVHPSSVLFKNPVRHILYTELVLTTKAFIRTLSSVESEWIPELRNQPSKKRRSILK